MASIRIFGGRHANRNIAFLDDAAIRPTSVRARKVLFDWLRFEVRNKRCLDLFSGSGILGFEAMSQGAESVLCVDHNEAACLKIGYEARRVGENGLTVLCKKIPFEIKETFDVCFMDPPFSQKKLYEDTFKWLEPVVIAGGFLYVEANECLEDMEAWTLYKKKKVSSVWMHLYQRAGA